MAKKKTPSKPKRIFILGDGAWGTALGIVLSGKDCRVTIWGNFPEYTAKMIKRGENFKFLPGVKVPKKIEFTAGFDSLDRGCDLMIMAVPAQFSRGVLVRAADSFPVTLPVVSVAKGIEVKTRMRPTSIVREVLGRRFPIAVLSGPTHAEEVARRIPTSAVVAGHDVDFALEMQELFNTDRFRVYTNDDIIGVEMAAALKNVIAIAAGICDGMGWGDNAKSALLARGLVEMMRFVTAMGGRRETLSGLAGVGDLVTTCFSKHGRNRAFGERIGSGETLADILASTEKVAEGVMTTKAVFSLAKIYNVDLPITTEVYRILFKGKSITRALNDLMKRSTKSEID